MLHFENSSRTGFLVNNNNHITMAVEEKKRKRTGKAREEAKLAAIVGCVT